MLFKNLKILSLILIASFLIRCGGKEENSQLSTKEIKQKKKVTLTGKKIFGIKSGIIYYEVSGSQTGEKKLYFADWGQKQAEFSNTTIRVGKYKKHSNLLKISNGDLQYIIDLAKNTGTKRKNPLLEKLEEFGEQVNYNDFGEQIILINGGIDIGSEKVAGRKCRIYDFPNRKSKSWVWNWITLKTETHSGGVDIVTVAKDVTENAGVADSIFSPPKGAMITEIDFSGLKDEKRGENF